MEEPQDVPFEQERNEALKESPKDKKLPDDRIPKKLWKQECFDLISDVEANNNFKESSSDLLKNIEDIKRKIKLTIQEINDTKKVESECNSNEQEFEKERYILKLHKEITKLAWDPDSTEDEIRGFVARSRLKAFHLNTKEHSQYYIVNHLWNLIDDDEQEDT